MAFRCPPELDRFRCALPDATGYSGDEANGIVHWKPEGLMIQFSNGLGWEHVSVSRRSRTPSWEDMHRIKRLFWSDEDCVIQYHPPAADYVNNHPFCLHLWRPIDGEIVRPPAVLVGAK